MWAKLGAKVLSYFSGPFKWVASIFLDKLFALIGEAIKSGYNAILDAIAEGKRKKEAAKKDQTYQDTLKDGAKNEDQVKATTDIINNGRD